MVASAGAMLFGWLAILGSGCGPGLGAIEVTATASTTPSGTPTPGQLSGDVLIAGGIDSTGNLVKQAEIYDPASGTFSNTGTMVHGRAFHTATVLSNGTILLTGGQTPAGAPLNTAEIYNESNEKFKATAGKMVVARSQHTATELPNGQVLLAGGIGSNGVPLASAELYDPTTGKFTATKNPMNFKRAEHTAVLLDSGPNSGQVLIAGGFSNATQTEVQNTAELYDPNTQTFTQTSTLMRSARYFHQAQLFAGGNLAGQVLLTGGNDGSVVNGTGELYDPSADSFNAAGVMTITRMQFASAPVTSSGIGMILLCGGLTNNGTVTATAELYNPSSSTFGSTIGNMTDSRRFHTAISFTSGPLAGEVLIAGGQSSTGIASTINTAELFDPTLGTFAATGPMASARYGHTAVILP
jgi:hypothetical protein